MNAMGQIIHLKVGLIIPNPKQPRKYFNPVELAQLEASIREHGVVQPLLVSRRNGQGKHILIAGERRLRSAQKVGLKTVPAIVHDIKEDDLENLGLIALVENVIRSDMSPVEEGQAYLDLRKQGLNNSRIAKKVGVNDVRVGNCINCALLPEETRSLIATGRLFTSPEFVKLLKEIAEVDPATCDELAKEIESKQPALKVAIKSARGVLAYIKDQVEKKGKKPRKTKKNIVILEVASTQAGVEIDEEVQPNHWDVLQQAGNVPAWSVLVEAATTMCQECPLYQISSQQMCSECTAAQMLARAVRLTREKGGINVN